MQRESRRSERTDDGFFVHHVCLRPGDSNDSPVWNAYIRPLVEPFVDDDSAYRYANEEEFHELIWKVWSDAGVDNDVTLEHEDELSTGGSSARGSRIDFRAYYDDGHRVGVEIKAVSQWTYDIVQDQLVRYAETGELDSILLLTADPEMTEIDWPRHLTVPLFVVLLNGRRGLL